jgi:WD40 repeat protein
MIFAVSLTVVAFHCKGNAPIPSPQPIHEIKLDVGVTAMNWSQNGSAIAAGLESGEVALIDPQSWQVSSRFAAAKDGKQVGSICFSPEGKLLACEFSSDIVRVFDAKTKILMQEIQLSEEEWVHSIDFSADGKLFCIGTGGKGTVNLYSTATWAVVAQFHEADARLITPNSTPIIYSIAFHPDSRQMAVGLQKGAVLLATNGLVEVKAFPMTEQHAVRTMAFTPDGKLLATAGAIVQIWKTAGQDPPLSLPKDVRAPINYLDFSDDGKLLLIAYGMASSESNIVAVYSLEHGKTVAHFPCHSQNWAGACFIPNTHRIATAAMDGTIQEWSVNLEEPK